LKREGSRGRTDLGRVPELGFDNVGDISHSKDVVEGRIGRGELESRFEDHTAGVVDEGGVEGLDDGRVGRVAVSDHDKVG
jgi:hypothetical protein